MKRALIPALLCAAVLGVAACGDDDEGAAGTPPATTAAPTPTTTAKKPTPRPKPAGTKIKLADSQFGRILYDGKGQAIYLFTKDERDRTRCFGACADAWPPVYTKGAPQAVDGVMPGLLGTIRREGRLQVTYKGQPLYYYAHEGPNEVTCQNVEEFGGLWLVVQGSGEAVR